MVTQELEYVSIEEAQEFWEEDLVEVEVHDFPTLMDAQELEYVPIEGPMEEATPIPKTLPDLDYDPFEEKRTFAFASLDDALQAIVGCIIEERGSQWKIGAVVASAIDTFGPYGTYKKLASACAYTTRRLKTFEVLHRTFPADVIYPEEPLLLYETALRADDPVEAVLMALDEEWSPRELADAISEEKGETVSRVKLFDGEAVVMADGPDWQIHVEAGRDWPEGNGVHQCYVTVKQIIQEDNEE